VFAYSRFFGRVVGHNFEACLPSKSHPNARAGQDFCTSDGRERCVICRDETDVPISRHADMRLHYMSGVGQLCPTCFEDLAAE
jgi:hypothetical protein